MAIYDCFSFYNELDILEIRLNVLKDIVDKFVLVEARKTHTGVDKPLYFNENKDRFYSFADRIVHIVVDDFPIPPADYTPRQAAWMCENYQRNQAVLGLKDAKDDDLIICSDVDEIPNPTAVLACRGKNGVSALRQYLHYYYLNYRDYIRPYWCFAKVFRFSSMANASWKDKLKGNEFIDQRINDRNSLSCCRLVAPDRTIPNGGWHFSYLGGVDAVMRKLRAIAHTECDTNETRDAEWIECRIAAGEDVTGGNDRFFATPLGSTYPPYILQHADCYSKLIFPCDRAYLARTRLARFFAWMRSFIRRRGRN